MVESVRNGTTVNNVVVTILSLGSALVFVSPFRSCRYKPWIMISKLVRVPPYLFQDRRFNSSTLNKLVGKKIIEDPLELFE